MALFDANIRKLPGARRVQSLLFAVSVIDALLVAMQAASLAHALASIWEGVAFFPFSQVAVLVSVFLASYVARQAIACVRGLLLDHFARRHASELRRQLLERLYERGPAFVQTKGTGATITLLIDGVDKVRTYLSLVMPRIADLLALPAVLSVVLLAVDVPSGIVAIVVLPCIIAYMRLLGGYAKEAAASQHGEYERLSNHFVDSLRGIQTLIAFGRGESYGKRVFRTSERFREATITTLRSATLSSLVMELFRTFAVAAVAILLGFRLMAGSVTLASALTVLIVVPEYFAAVRRYASDFHATLDGQNNLASILEALGEEVTADAGRDDADAPTTAHTPAALPSLIPFAAEGIGYSYARAEGFALRDVSFAIDRPLKVGIVGPSGSGKSTLVRLLAGLDAPTTGSFTVAGQRMNSLRHPIWQAASTYLPQSPHVFCGTLRENIAFYHPQATQAQVAAAAHAAGLDELASSLPDGLDTRIGEGERTLSGGQLQRVALSRALVADTPRVLLFDEPTAHLDIETEFAIKQLILPLMRGRLVFFATHRLHWMADMDYLLVLDQGRLVQQGTYEELAAASGPFARLLEACEAHEGGRHD